MDLFDEGERTAARGAPLGVELIEGWTRTVAGMLESAYRLGTLTREALDRYPWPALGDWRAAVPAASPAPAGESRVALVAGEGALCTAIARHLEAAGYRVVVAASGACRAGPTAAATGGAPRACDTRDLAACNRVVADVLETYGRIDVLVNCLPDGDEDCSPQAQLDAVFYLSKSALETMVARGYGRIVNVLAPARGGTGLTVTPAKAGVLGFSRSLAREVAARGVTVNVVAPGYLAGDRGTDTAGVLPRIPAGRLAQPEDVAGAVVFLASEASAYITGTELAVNGGLGLP